MREEPEAPPSGLRDELSPKAPPVPPSTRGMALAGFTLGYLGFALAAIYTWILPGPSEGPYRYLLTAGMAAMAIGFTLALLTTAARDVAHSA